MIIRYTYKFTNFDSVLACLFILLLPLFLLFMNFIHSCAVGNDSEVLLKPRAIYRDPFRGGKNILVICDTYEPPKPEDAEKDMKLKPLPTNTRHACNEAMEKAKAEKPWFGIEQV